jgi:hypothetical protein
VFTGKLATGAGAFESEVEEVNLRVVGFPSASLHIPPEDPLIELEIQPFLFLGQFFTRFERGGIRGQQGDLFFRKIIHKCLLYRTL